MELVSYSEGPLREWPDPEKLALVVHDEPTWRDGTSGIL